MPLLEVRDLTVAFGGLRALQDVSFAVDAGEIHGLIGPNGAGKTTLFNCISRLLDPTAGQIHYDGGDLLRVPPHGIAALGIARTFQNLELCRNLTVLDNVLLGLHHRLQVPMLHFALRLPGARRAEAGAREEAHRLLALCGVGQVAGAPAQALPYGILKRVELARALACRPRLLLLDEPAAGLNNTERAELADLIRRVRQELGVTVLMVEHDMGMVMSLCDRLTVLDFGRRIAGGTPAEVQDNPAVIAAYLGEGGAGAHAEAAGD